MGASAAPSGVTKRHRPLDRLDTQILNILQDDASVPRGATRLREPGWRPDISKAYYGMMIQDPDAHGIEVVHWSR